MRFPEEKNRLPGASYISLYVWVVERMGRGTSLNEAAEPVSVGSPLGE